MSKFTAKQATTAKQMLRFIFLGRTEDKTDEQATNEVRRAYWKHCNLNGKMPWKAFLTDLIQDQRDGI